MTNWKKYKLGEIASFSNGRSRPAAKDDGLFPIYGGNGILGYTDQYNSFYDSIIIGRVGAYCGSVFYENKACWVSDNAIQGKNKVNSDSKFLFYLLTSLKLNNHHIGTSQPLLTQEILNSFEIIAPPLPEQQAIASILSSLDDKIELNRKQNETLEKIAQAIFKHWFVDFEFPNDEGKPYKSSGGEMQESELGLIPKGWRVGKLGEVMELAYGKALKEEIRNDGEYLVIGSNGIVGKHDEYLVEAPGIVIGRKGTIGEVNWIDKNFFPIDTTFYIKDLINVYGLYYHYFVLKAQDFKRINSDSAVPGLNRNEAYKNLLIIPDKKIIDKFSQLIQNFFNKRTININENQTLSQLRDELLPKLMSGNVRVKIIQLKDKL